MVLLCLLRLIVVYPSYGTDACLPRRTKELTDSYVPVGIQALIHYSSQLQLFYPYEFTDLCKRGIQSMSIVQRLPQADVCVAESVAKINLFLTDLQREAAEQNLEDSQGLSRSVLNEIEKTSQMTGAQQFHFILKKLQKEDIRSRAVGCKITEFLQDVENPNSKLYRNLMNVKPLSFLK